MFIRFVLIYCYDNRVFSEFFRNFLLHDLRYGRYHALRQVLDGLDKAYFSKTFNIKVWMSERLFFLYHNLFIVLTTSLFWMHRSSRSQMFFKIVVLKNFAKFTRKHLCWSLFSIKLQALRPATLLKRDSDTGAFLWILQNF